MRKRGATQPININDLAEQRDSYSDIPAHRPVVKVVITISACPAECSSLWLPPLKKSLPVVLVILHMLGSALIVAAATEVWDRQRSRYVTAGPAALLDADPTPVTANAR